MEALITIVRSGKALYAGISKYPPELQAKAYAILSEAHVPCLLSQYRASIFDTQAIENNFQPAAAAGSGVICFSPLAQGLLTRKYFNGIPADSRAAKSTGFLQESQVTPERVEAAKELNAIAERRGETLAAMAINWLLADQRVTSVIIGASSVRQLKANIDGLRAESFTPDDLVDIYRIAHRPGIQF